jgi:hypothetical protein
MKRTVSLLAVMAIFLGWAGAVRADGPNPEGRADLGLSALSADQPQMTPATEGGPPFPFLGSAICAVGTYQGTCTQTGSGSYNGVCGPTTWKYWTCDQYKNSAGKFYIQNCDGGHEVCSKPTQTCKPCV